MSSIAHCNHQQLLIELSQLEKHKDLCFKSPESTTQINQYILMGFGNAIQIKLASGKSLRRVGSPTSLIVIQKFIM